MHGREAAESSRPDPGRNTGNPCDYLGGIAVFQRVLLCYDGSLVARRALRRGAELAVLVKARVHVLCIVPESVADASVVAASVGTVCLVDPDTTFRESLAESLELLRARGVEAEGHLARGNTIDAIVSFAKRLSVDLVVVGHYPQTTRGRWWSGPERASLAERLNCCVLIAMDAAANPPLQ